MRTFLSVLPILDSLALTGPVLIQTSDRRPTATGWLGTLFLILALLFSLVP